MAKKCSVETFSRITGFMRPVQTWNKGKAAEFHERKKFQPSIGDNKGGK